jgi:hypothetical protein
MKNGIRYLTYYGSGILLAVCILLFYLYIIHPVRRTFVQHVALPVVAPHYDNPSAPFTIINRRTALAFTFIWHNEQKTTRYQPQFGLFFLITVIALLFITLRPRWYLILAAFHLLAMLLVTSILYFSRFGWYPGFMLIDFFVAYLIPGLTFAYVVLVFNIETEDSLLQRLNIPSLKETGRK